MAMQPAVAGQNGRCVWLYKQLPATGSQIYSLQWRTPFFADTRIRCWNASSSRIRTSRSDQLTDSVIPCSYPPSIQRASQKSNFPALLQMPRRHCKTCTSPLHVDDTHAECVSCLGKSHAEAALSGTDRSHCVSFSFASLRSWIAFFSERDAAPHALPFSSSQGPVRKKQQGRGFEQPIKSELTPAQCSHASPSPQREHSPVLFIQHDQRPSAAASDMILLFGVSDIEMDAFLWQFQTRKSYRALWPTPPSCRHLLRNTRLRVDEELIRVMTKAINELGLERSPPEKPSRSRLDEWFLSGRHQALCQCLSPFFPEVHDELTKSWCAPYSSRIRPSASVSLTSVDGAEEKGYEHLPPLDESVATHLCLPTAFERKARASHSSKRAEPHLHSLDAPTRRLDKRLQRFTRWLCSRSSRPRCSPMRKPVWIQPLSGTWGARQTWLYRPPKPPPKPSGVRCPAW